MCRLLEGLDNNKHIYHFLKKSGYEQVSFMFWRRCKINLYSSGCEGGSLINQIVCDVDKVMNLHIFCKL